MPREPERLKRLRKGVQASGLNADLSALSPLEQAIVVTNRLAQTTVRHLTNQVDPAAGRRLSEELKELASPDEHKLFTEDTGYTFFHVVQFLYEFAKTHASIPNREYFCSGMGRGGGGIEVAPHREVISLVRLLITALSPANDRRNVGVLIRELGPLILGQIFTTGMFHIHVAPEQENRLRIGLQYASRDRVAACLKTFDLDRDTGAFFLNSALHIQGTLQLAWETFAQDAAQTIRMTPLIETCDENARQTIQDACACAWTVTWRPDVRLNRLPNDEETLERARTVYQALNRKDLEYYLERITHLEMRVQSLEEVRHFHDLIGGSAQMQRIYQTIQQVAPSDLTVLIRGETGTGKELVARAIHESSPRRGGPFVAINCAAFTETLLESELFGHEKGAFTGADRAKPGRFEMADGGTLFLDEVGDLPQVTQVKLLRVLETRTFERVGGTRTLRADIRIIGATNRDLEDLTETGHFREDLYFRLNVIPFHLPALREHSEDIPLLTQHFIHRIAERTGKPLQGISRGGIRKLLAHPWPGNIRDLQNTIERAAVYARGATLTETDIDQALGIRSAEAPADDALNLRQREILNILRSRPSGCTVEDLLAAAQSAGGWGSGCSRRTLLNDLRKLSDRGYAAWIKQGRGRRYTVPKNP